MLRQFFVLMLLLSLLSFASPQDLNARTIGPREMLFVPWGDSDPAQLQHRIEPGGRVGPLSFRVAPADGAISLLDGLDHSLKVFRGGALSQRLPAPDGARDFLPTDHDGILFLARNQLLLYQAGQQTASYRPQNTLPLIEHLEQAAGALVAIHHDGSRVHLSPRLSPVMSSPEPTTTPHNFAAVRHSASAIEIRVTAQDGRQLSAFRLPVATGNLGGVRVIGSDRAERIYLDVDLVLQAVPLAVQREVWVVTRDGAVQGRIQLPTHYFTWAFRDLELLPNGDLFHMLSAADGVHVFRWSLADITDGATVGDYPSRYRKKLHYNLELSAKADGPHTDRRAPDKATAVVTVTRNQAVATGDTYVQHQWTATPANLTNGIVTDPDGDLVQTPAWVVVGLNQAVPYKWGGYNTISYFDTGMASGYYAGDIHTDGYSAYARGVDCSGFICRCWNTDTVYTTREMDDPDYGPITLPLASWDDIQAGDAIHKHGHVRMAIAGVQDGSILVVESAGTATDWRVGYSSYTLAELEGYTPRYYVGMDGALPAIVSANSGSWTEGSTWVGGLAPTSADDVLILSGHTISVDGATATCRSVNFGADDALIDLNANSTLTVYGNFTIFSTTHTVFSAGWSATDAYLKFAGSADQVLSGFRTDGGSTSFRDVIVDKDGGMLTTAGGGMRLGIQNSLEIVNGLFELAAGDDLEGRWASSGNYRGGNLPNIVIRGGGEFKLADGDGAHHMRSDYDGGVQTPIGAVTVYGSATFRDGSTYRIRLTAVDIESGGKVITSLGMGGGEFECGPLHIKAGAELENYTTSDCWGASAVVTLDAGGLFDTKSSTTVFPGSFANNGTVRYSREATTDQAIVDMDYHDLEISLDADNNKNWLLAGDRTIAAGLKINYGANLVLTAGAARSLTVNTLLNLTSGQLINSDADVALTMAGGALIQRATGVITNSPFFAGPVDLRYTSTGATVTTGPEIPTTAGLIRNFTVDGDQGVNLSADITVTGTCTTTGSDLVTGSFGVTLGPAATLSEADGTTVLGTVAATRTLATAANEDFGGIGLELLAGAGAPGLTQAIRTTGVSRDINGADGIEREFLVTAANNDGLDARVIFHYDTSELNGIAENTLGLYTSGDGGNVWSGPFGGATAGRTVTATGLNSLALLTLGQGGVSGVDGGDLPQRTAFVSLYPNPFNPTTRIVFDLARTGPVAVGVYDLRGQQVRRLAAGTLTRGQHNLIWRGLDNSGRAVASGVYFCRLVAGGETRTLKMVLTR